MRLKEPAAYVLVLIVLAAAHPQAWGHTPSTGETVLVDPMGRITAYIYNATQVTDDDLTRVAAALLEGLPVGFVGGGAEGLPGEGGARGTPGEPGRLEGGGRVAAPGPAGSPRQHPAGAGRLLHL